MNQKKILNFEEQTKDIQQYINDLIDKTQVNDKLLLEIVLSKALTAKE